MSWGWLVKKAIGVFFFVACVGLLLIGGQDKVEKKMVEGVEHVLNPAKPLKGAIELQIERTREIDPYEQPDCALRMVGFSRDAAGQVVLFDPNGAEAHRFAPDGKYLGLLTKKGQGPGEFSPFQGYHVVLQEPDIWVFGGRKVARLDGQGRLIKDKAIASQFSGAAGAGRYITEAVTWKENDRRDQTRTLQLVELSMNGTEDKAIDLLKADNIGMIRNPNGQGGFSDPWATPRFFYTTDPARGLVYCGLNTDYRIEVRDFAGKTVRIIRKAYEPIKVRKADVEKIMSPAAKSDQFKWMISAYPDRFVAVASLEPMPKGYLAVFRISGPELTEIDVFSPQGECLYSLIPPADVKMNECQFFSTGFGTVEQDGDYSVYREYRIKNLPEIFGKFD